MPCIILTGHPCSGKSTLAYKIRDRAIASFSIGEVVVISEESACPGKSMMECYMTSESEKKTRGALKAAFDREVAARANDDSTLIILDSLNYIKGFRYELHCISKAAAKKHCVVWCLLAQQNVQGRYSDELYMELKRRFEPPDERNRWDRPLYRVERTHVAAKILDQSVYNMHNLAETIGALPTESSADTTFMPPTGVSQTQRKSAFKRSSKTKRKPSSTDSEPKIEQKLTAAVLSKHEQVSSATILVGDSKGTKLATNERQDEKLSGDNSFVTQMSTSSIDDQIDAFLGDFLGRVQKLKEGSSTRQHVRTDANLMNRISSIIASENDPTLRQQYLRWVAMHPPPDTTERGIRDSFAAFSKNLMCQRPS